MWGAIIGDVVGSRFENENLYSEFFELFDENCKFTDDTVMTIATLMVLQNYDPEEITEEKIEHFYRKIGCSYIQRGFGGMFYQWLVTYNQKAYGSFGNGALMRISPLAKWAVDKKWTKEKMLSIADKFTNITHNNQQAIDAVHLYLTIIYELLLRLKDIDDYTEREKESRKIILNLIEGTVWENVDKSKFFKIQNTKELNMSCEYTLKVVFSALKETIEDENYGYTYKFEGGIKKIISLGGDCDTTAAILGPLLEVIYGIPAIYKNSIVAIAFKDFDKPMLDALNNFYGENVPNDIIYVSPNISDVITNEKT